MMSGVDIARKILGRWNFDLLLEMMYFGLKANKNKSRVLGTRFYKNFKCCEAIQGIRF